MQILLGTLAFIMSIAWLNIEANEVVAILDTFGLCFGIDTGESLCSSFDEYLSVISPSLSPPSLSLSLSLSLLSISSQLQVFLD